MSQILTLKINVKAFHKDAFYVGEKGTYATISVFVNDEKDEYGNFGMIRQDLGKERREAGEKGPILGNVTRVFNQQGNGQPAARQMNDQARDAQQQSRPKHYREEESDIPF
jgi:hypothetical protein